MVRIRVHDYWYANAQGYIRCRNYCGVSVPLIPVSLACICYQRHRRFCQGQCSLRIHAISDAVASVSDSVACVYDISDVVASVASTSDYVASCHGVTSVDAYTPHSRFASLTCARVVLARRVLPVPCPARCGTSAPDLDPRCWSE